MIELTGITAGYGSYVVLKDLSASFEKGSLTSIVGVNGCGKSTLLKTILGIVPVACGEITIDAANLSSMSRKSIAQKAAYLSQEKNTPDMTVEQMVLHGRFPYLEYPRRYTAQDREMVRRAMERVGVAAFADKLLPTLSGGMRQNAYIAMALAQSTDYILLDEPTTFLDIAHQLTLMRTLRNLADNGKGVIAVMHDLPMAFTFSDRILLLHNGQAAACEKPEVLCRQGMIEDVFGVAVVPAEDRQSYRYQYKQIL